MINNLPSDQGETDTLQDRARIVCEICERFDELDAIRKGSSHALIKRLSTLASESEQGFQLVIQLMHGNTALLSQFKRIDPSRKVTRQAAQQRLDRTIRFLRCYSPPLAHYVTQIRQMRHHHEDPPHSRNTGPGGIVRTSENSHTNGGVSYDG